MTMIRYGSYNRPIVNDSDFAVTQNVALRNRPGVSTAVNDNDQTPTAVKQVIHAVGYVHTETHN